MEDDSVATIRETSRNILKLSRRFHRDEDTDKRRIGVSTSITEQRVVEIATRLKTKSPICLAELLTLKVGLLEDGKNIELVLNIHGALRGLVRELTGSDVRNQCAAAGCFCNLALGDSKAGFAVTKAAGPYMVTALDSFTTELALICAWAVGNLAGSSAKASDLLTSQGALSKLCDLLVNTNEELRDAATYALVHFGYQMKDELRTDHLSKILEALSKTDINTASCQLLFILSCHKDFIEIGLSENHLEKLLQNLPLSMQIHLNACQNVCSKDCKLLDLLRILANVNLDSEIYNIFVQCFSQIVEGFKALLFKEDSLTNSVLWLLGNLYNFNNNNVFFNELLR